MTTTQEIRDLLKRLENRISQLRVSLDEHEAGKTIDNETLSIISDRVAISLMSIIGELRNEMLPA